MFLGQRFIVRGLTMGAVKSKSEGRLGFRPLAHYVTAHPTARDFALILLVVAMWGFSFVPIKLGLREVPPFALAALRFFFAAVPLVFFVRPPRMPLARSSRTASRSASASSDCCSSG